jgi:hypothetical protein
VGRLEILDATERVEHEAKFDRTLGYESLTLRVVGWSVGR